ncbi:MAG: prepilin-type N-terminal cleavage/methylation domain-containing protein [Deltaproteobacteria bacterium]|nr:prepilin-type N-terminal cleavage/methylation domain-containing protein [Deltaproteobacteria bacterium]
MNMKARIKRQEGFTIIEVIVAISILTVGLLAVASMQVTGMHANAHARNVTEGINWAQDKLEELIALPYDDPNNLGLIDTDNDGLLGLGNNIAATADYSETRGRFTICWNIAEDEPVASSKTIRIYVNWQDKGVTKRVLLNYIRSG